MEPQVEYFDRLEVRDPEERELALFIALPGLLRHAIDNAPAIGERLRGVAPHEIVDRQALSTLPVLRASDAAELQRASPPFGGLAATPVRRLARVFVSPGPVFHAEGARRDYWRLARALWAGGARKGQIVHNALSHHLTPLGSMLEAGARALGCPIAPAGPDALDRQVELIEAVRPRIFAGAPDLLFALAERLGSSAPFERAIVAVDGRGDSMSERDASALGVDVLRFYATAELGLIAFEGASGGGLVLDESVIVELVEPGGERPVAEGEVGEVVVTVFNPDYPLIRFSTGDLAAFADGPSPCGRTNRRLKGVLGRVDQIVEFDEGVVYPHQLAAIASEVGARRVLCRPDRGREAAGATLIAEAAAPSEALASRIVERVFAATGMRFGVEVVREGELALPREAIGDLRV